MSSKKSKIPKNFPSRFWPGEPKHLWDNRSLPAPSPVSFSLTDKQRLAVVRREVWVDYPTASRICKEIEDLTEIRSPDLGSKPMASPFRVSRYERQIILAKPNEVSVRKMLLVSSENNGASTLISNIRKSTQFHGKSILINMPTNIDSKVLREAFLAAVGQDNLKLPLGHRWLQALDQRRHASYRVMIVDNVENLRYLPQLKRFQTIALLRQIGEEFNLALIMIIPPWLNAFISRDSVWSGRFERSYLSQWRIDSDYLDFLQAYEEYLPLQQVSDLSSRELALHLYALSDGRLGRLVSILRKGAAAAIENASERITIQLLDNLNLTPPPEFNGFKF